ncbi:MAG: hypothetical protein ACKV2T_14910 [Kofleriaceae bacterium]
MRRTLPAILGFAALVLSPQLACTSEDEGLSQAQIDAIRESVEGTWEFTDGATTIQMRLTQSARDFDPDDPYASLSFSLFEEAYACGSHGLVKPANACVDVYYMPFDVEIVTGTAPDSRATLLSLGGTTNNEIWIKLGANELRGIVVNDVVTLQGSTTKTLRKVP